VSCRNSDQQLVMRPMRQLPAHEPAYCCGDVPMKTCKERGCRFWLQDRCFLLLREQQRVRVDGLNADADFRGWNAIFEKACAMGPGTCHQGTVSLVATNGGPCDVTAALSLSLGQLHAMFMATGSSVMLQYAAEMLDAAMPKTPEEEEVLSPLPGTAIQSGDAAPQSTELPLAMTLQISMHVAALQATVQAGRRRFIEALTSDVEASATFEVVPTAKPAGLLLLTLSVASLRMDHGRDMLTQTDVFRSVLCAPVAAPAAPQAEAGKGADNMADAPGAPTGVLAGASLRQWHDAADLPCLQLQVEQLVQFDGAHIGHQHPKALVNVQVRNSLCCAPCLLHCPDFKGCGGGHRWGT
jgi:hypothetical protein